MTFVLMGCYGPPHFKTATKSVVANSTTLVRADALEVSVALRGASAEVIARRTPRCRPARHGDLVKAQDGVQKANRAPGLTIGIIGVVAAGAFLLGPFLDEEREEGSPSTVEFVFAGLSGAVALSGFGVAALTPAVRPVQRREVLGPGAEWAGEETPCATSPGGAPQPSGMAVLSTSAGGVPLSVQASLNAGGHAKLPIAALSHVAARCGTELSLALSIVDTGEPVEPRGWPQSPPALGAPPVVWEAEPVSVTLTGAPQPNLSATESAGIEKALLACAASARAADVELAATHPEAGDGAIYGWVTHRDYADNTTPSGLPRAVDSGRIQYVLRAGSARLSNPMNYDLRTAMEGQLLRHLARQLPGPRANGTPRPLVVLGSYEYVARWRRTELDRCVAPCQVTKTDNLGFVPRAQGGLKKLIRAAQKASVAPPARAADVESRVRALAAAACGCGATRNAAGACPPALDPVAMARACTLRTRKPVVCACPQ